MRVLIKSFSSTLQKIRWEWELAVYFYYTCKIIFKMPFDEWKTFKEIQAFGCPHDRLVVLMGFFLSRNIFEARFSIDAFMALIQPGIQNVTLETHGMISFEVAMPEAFEYRLVRRPTEPERDWSWTAIREAMSPA